MVEYDMVRRLRAGDRAHVGTMGRGRLGLWAEVRGGLLSRGDAMDCFVVRAGEIEEGKQRVGYFPGISQGSAGAKGICMHLLTIPPGGRAKAHLHEDHETALYVLSGAARMWFGEGLSEVLEVRAGDFLYIPAGVPHLPVNLSDAEPATAVVARTDPNEQEGVVLLPQLDGVVPDRIGG